jgi:hypothetical protein
VTEEQAQAIFLLAGITVVRAHKIENGYWPYAYLEERKRSPWWLLESNIGIVIIGWRKRVISIDWTSVAVRQVITEDDVTKDEMSVHAYSYAKAVEYLAKLARAHSVVLSTSTATIADPESVSCVHCLKPATRADIATNDSACPHCSRHLDMDEEPYAE